MPHLHAFRLLYRTASPKHASPLLRTTTRLVHYTARPPTRRPLLRPTSAPGAPLRSFLPRRLLSSPPPQKPPSPTPNLTLPSSLSFSQRLRKLSREYGWAAFGVYLALTALDFPFCFLAVRALGTERIAHWENAVITWVQRAVPIQLPPGWGWGKKEGEIEVAGGEGVVGYGHGVEEAEKMNAGENASIWTQLALAYAIHKSFIFIRVPLTVTVTPRVVKVLRGWGWNIGKRRPKEVRDAAKAAKAAAKK